jgi:molybdate-binding protein/DNA-binding transcriptional regulator YhcF (GntR family)
LAIAGQLVQRIAAGELQPGERLPPVRQAAALWGVNLNTVARAYAHLASRGILQAHAGGGTRVAPVTEESLRPLREARLRGLLAESIGTALGMGYAPSEVEAAFVGQLAQWRALRRRPTTASRTADAGAGRMVRVGGSHDLSLELLCAHLRGGARRVRVRLELSSSLGGLFALAGDGCDLVGCHLLDAETGEYNVPFVRRVLPGQPIDLVTLAEREQGLIVAPDNPRRIREVADLARPGVRFVNRQRGAGTRVLLDRLLAAAGVPASAVPGYSQEEPTHLAVAGAVAAGRADVGLGIRAAAHALGLGFVLLARERYELALHPASAERAGVRQLLATLRSAEFTAAVAALAGYDTRETGRVRRVTG